MMRKKVVLVINCLQGGGAERAVLTLGEGFHNLGYEVHIIRFKSTVEYKLSDTLHHHQVDFKPYRLIPNHRLRHKLFAKKIDYYINKNIGKPFLILSNLDRADRVMRFSKLPNIFHIIHNNLSKKIELLNANTQNSLSDLKDVYSKHPCICVSHGVEEDFRKTLGITNTKTIYNPIDSQKIKLLAQQELSIEIDEYILHVGSFKKQKAHDVLIKAYAKTNMSLPLILLGKGKLFEQTKDLVVSLGLDDKVKFVGFHDNPYPYIKNAKVMILASSFEGFGLVIAEALVLDTPVISTDCPSGPSELLPENNLVPVGDIDALAQKIQAAMQAPKDYSMPFDTKFLPTNIAAQYIELVS